MYTREIFHPECSVCVTIRDWERLLEVVEAKKILSVDHHIRDIYYQYLQEYGDDEDTFETSSESSFELLDPHDPTLSRLATLLFKSTNEFLLGETNCSMDHYAVLEEINHIAISKYTDLRNIAQNLDRTMSDYNDKYGETIKPLLAEVDVIDEMVAKLEDNAYRLDGYTKKLKTRIRDMLELK